MSNLYQASDQWATRPPDERFGSLAEMLQATRHYADVAREFEVQPTTIDIAERDGEPVVVSIQTGRQSKLTHWAMGQLSARAGAPADYLRSLPAELAVPNLRYGLMRRAVEEGDKPVKLLVHEPFASNGHLPLIRAVTGIGYQRFWNYRVVEGLQALGEVGWQVPPARPAMADQPGTRVATADDVIRGDQWALSIKEGDLIAPAGLYASDHDMFAFMVNTQYYITAPGSTTPLYRGFFVSHSEVGESAYKVFIFWLEHVCGNHIVWNAHNVREISFKHVGKAIERITDHLQVQLKEYVGQATMFEQERLNALAAKELGASKEEVVDLLFNRRLLSRALAERAYDACETEQTPIDGSNPRSPWGIAQGLTRISQMAQYADQRNQIDRMAGKILEVF